MSLKQKLLIVLANMVVIAVVAGLSLAFLDLSNGVRVASLVILIVTLLIPSVASLLIKKFDSPEAIVTIILIVANLIASLIMLFTPVLDSKPLIITESIIGGLYITILLLCIALKPKEDK